MTVTRKLKPAVPAETAAAMVEKLTALTCVPVDAELVRRARLAGRRWQLSHWDSLVIEAARQSRCTRVLTEDLSDGAECDGLLIQNPFK